MAWMIWRGFRGLPVAWAGHAFWQRPHSVQLNPSKRSFQVKSVTTPTPKSFPGAKSSRGCVLGCSRFLKKQFGNGGDDMHVFASRKQAHEGQQDEGMNPPEEIAEGGKMRIASKHGGDDARDGLGAGCSLRAHGNPDAVEAEKGDHQQADETENKESFETAGLDVCAVEVVRLEEEAAGEGYGDRHQGEGRDDVKGEEESLVDHRRQQGRGLSREKDR